MLEFVRLSFNIDEVCPIIGRNILLKTQSMTNRTWAVIERTRGMIDFILGMLRQLGQCLGSIDSTRAMLGRQSDCVGDAQVAINNTHDFLC